MFQEAISKLNIISRQRHVGICTECSSVKLSSYGTHMHYPSPKPWPPKNMHLELKIIMDGLVEIMNVIKSQTLNFRIFTQLCEDMGTIHPSLLLHRSVVVVLRARVVFLFQIMA